MTRPQQAQPGHDIADQQVCILWHAPGATPGDALLGALGNKGMKVTLADNEHSVFAAACRCDGITARTVLVLDGRESLAGVDRVLSALGRFAPGVICWVYRDGANPPMIPLVHPSGRKQATRPPPVPAKTPARAALRLVGEGNGTGNGSVHSTPEGNGEKRSLPLSARDVLDADELDALLAGEMGERSRER